MAALFWLGAAGVLGVVGTLSQVVARRAHLAGVYADDESIKSARQNAQLFLCVLRSCGCGVEVPMMLTLVCHACACPPPPTHTCSNRAWETRSYASLVLVAAFFKEATGVNTCKAPGWILFFVSFGIVVTVSWLLYVVWIRRVRKARVPWYKNPLIRLRLRLVAQVCGRTLTWFSGRSCARVGLMGCTSWARSRGCRCRCKQTGVSLACLATHSLLPECHCSALASALICVAVGGSILTLYDFVLRSHYIKSPNDVCVKLFDNA